MLLLLLSRPRSGGRRRQASPLLAAAMLLCVLPVGAGLPAGSRCPLHIDCARERRLLCRPGSSHCGPCLALFEENEEGTCVLRRRHRQHGKETFYPDLDQEIDYLHSVIEKQEVTEIKPPKKHSKHPAADASKHKQRSGSRLSNQTLRATTAAPGPAASARPTTPTPQPRSTGLSGRAGPVAVPAPRRDGVIVVLVSLCVLVGTVAVILATVCFVKLQKESRLAQKVDYPAFRGAGGPAAPANSTAVADSTLAQSAQMYHYQHQKQQMLSAGTHKVEPKVHDTDVTSDEEEVGGDFTVYECPGLAPTGEMEVKNPLFDDSTLHYQGNHK